MDCKVSNMAISSVLQRMLEIFSKSPSISFEECRCYLDLFAYHYLQSLKVDLANCELSRRIFLLECSFNLKTFNGQIRSNQTGKFNGIHLTLVECVSILIALMKLVTKIENEDDISIDIKTKFLNNMGQLSKNLKLLVTIYPALSDSVRHVLSHAKLMFETCIDSDDLKRFMGVIYGDFEFSCDCINANHLISQFKTALATLLDLNEMLPQPIFLNCSRLFNENSFEYLSNLVLKILSLINSGDSTRSKQLERKFKNDEEIQRLFGNDLEDSVTLIAPDSKLDSLSDSNIYTLPSLPQINIASLPIVSTISGSKLKRPSRDPSSENSNVDVCRNSNESQIKRVLSEDSESFQEEILESEPEENLLNEPEIAQNDEIPIVDLSNGSSSIDNSKKTILRKTGAQLLDQQIMSPHQAPKTVSNPEYERSHLLQNRILIPTKNGIPNKLDNERTGVLSNQNLSRSSYSNDKAAELSWKENSQCLMKASQLHLSNFLTQMPSTSAENDDKSDGTNEKAFSSQAGVSKSTRCNEPPGRSSKPHSHSSESEDSLIYVKSHIPSTFPLGGVRNYQEGSDDSYYSGDVGSKMNPPPSDSSDNGDCVPYSLIPQYEEELPLDNSEITVNNPVLDGIINCVESELPKQSSGTSMREQAPYNSSLSSEASREENQNKQPGISGNRMKDNKNRCLIADVVVEDRVASRGTEVNLPNDNLAFGFKSASSKPKKSITVLKDQSNYLPNDDQHSDMTRNEKISAPETIIDRYKPVSLELEDKANKEMEEIVKFLDQIDTVATVDQNVVPRSNDNEVKVGSSISLVKDIPNPIKRERLSEIVISSDKNQTVKSIKQEPEEDIGNSAKSVEILSTITELPVSMDKTLPWIRANSEQLKTVVKLETVSDDEIEKRTFQNDLREKTIDEKKNLEITKRELESSMEMDDSLDQTLIPGAILNNEIVCATPRSFRLSRSRRRVRDSRGSSKSLCSTPDSNPPVNDGINSATPLVVNTPSQSTPNSKNNGEPSLLNSSSSSLGSPGFRRRLFNPIGNPILMETPATDVPLNDEKKTTYEPVIPNLPNNGTKPTKPSKTVRKGDQPLNNDLKNRLKKKKPRTPQYRLPILSSDDEEDFSRSLPLSQSANDSSKSRNHPASKPASSEISSNLHTAPIVNVAVPNNPDPGSDPNNWTDSDIIWSGAIPLNNKSSGNNPIESIKVDTRANINPSNGQNSQRDSRYFRDSDDNDDAILSSPLSRRNIPITTSSTVKKTCAKNNKRKIKLNISSSESSSDEFLSKEFIRKKRLQTSSRLSRKRRNAIKINEPQINNKPQISDKSVIKSNKPPKLVKKIPVVKLSRLDESPNSNISVEIFQRNDRTDSSPSKVLDNLDHRKSQTKSSKLNQRESAVNPAILKNPKNTQLDSDKKDRHSGHDNCDNCNDIDRQTYNLETNNNDSESSDEFSFHNKRKTKFTKNKTSSPKNPTNNTDKINFLPTNLDPILRIPRLNPANMFKQQLKEDHPRRLEPGINSEANKIVETASNNSEKPRKPKKIRRIIILTSESDSDMILTRNSVNSENNLPIDNNNKLVVRDNEVTSESSEHTDFSSDETLPINKNFSIISSSSEESSNSNENAIIHQEKTTAKRGAPPDFYNTKNDKRFASSLPELCSTKEQYKTIASNADEGLPKSGLRSEPANVDKVLPCHCSLVKHSNPIAKLGTNESLPKHRSHPKSLVSDVNETRPKSDSSKDEPPRLKEHSKSIASNVDEAVAELGLMENAKTNLDINQIRPSTSGQNDASTSSGRNLKSSSSRQTENQPSTSKVRGSMDLDVRNESPSRISDDFNDECISQADDSSKEDNNVEPSSKWFTKKVLKHDPKATKVLRRKPWSFEEEELLYIGVRKYGLGQWYRIAKIFGIQRTPQQLYDKWRNLSSGNHLLKVELRVKEGRKKTPVVEKTMV